ncbi:MAG: TRAP transporter small permease subunit [Betaproteobacteria bacterium]|nr:TRAP transporter small permease subunit [Betaproteobacteria bacterium]
MRFLDRLIVAAMAIAGFSILVMTLLGGADVLASAVGWPIPAVHEATEVLMVLVVFLCLGHLQMVDGNIAIDMLRIRFGPKGRRILDSVAQCVALCFFAALTWQASVLALESWAIREYSMGLVPFPMYPSKFAVAAGAALAAICSLARLGQIIAGKEIAVAAGPKME